jgi:undecaprenyl diphosphate synthase
MAASGKNGVPKHVAIIMDGNGRWAERRGLPKIEGHKAGSEAVRKTADAAWQMGIRYLTLYAFSTENWRRSPREVAALMRLLGDSIDENLDEMTENGIKLRVIGRRTRIPKKTLAKLDNAVESTRGNDKATMIVALNYGGRAEIADAAAKIASDAKNGKINPDKIDELTFEKYLYAPDIPDPDLLIRTSGEIRLSNFLLWETSYSELWFTETLWPDFGREDLEAALDDFKSRKRRFGGRK